MKSISIPPIERRRNIGRNRQNYKRRGLQKIRNMLKEKNLLHSNLPSTPYIKPLDDPDTNVPPLFFHPIYEDIQKALMGEELKTTEEVEPAPNINLRAHNDYQLRLFPSSRDRRENRVPKISTSRHMKSTIYSYKSKY